MSRLISILTLGLAIPLAACFDMSMSIAFPDSDHADMTVVMTMSPEFYSMAASSDENICGDTGSGEQQDDGSYVCTEHKSGTIDEIMADPDMGKGMTLERRDGGLIYVAFDLGSLTSDMMPPDDQDMSDMQDQLQQAFEGHGITINVSGAEIVETNGETSDDGKTASFTIPLTFMFDKGASLPDSFTVLVKPGA